MVNGINYILKKNHLKTVREMNILFNIILNNFIKNDCFFEKNLVYMHNSPFQLLY